MVTVPFPKLERSLLAQALSLTVTEAGMSLLLRATTLWRGCLVLCWTHCSWPWWLQMDKCRGIVSSSLNPFISSFRW